SVILQGKRPGDPASRPVMWIVPGQPVSAPVLPLFVDAGATPEVFWKGREAPLWVESLRIKNLAHSLKGRELEEYLDLARLDNREGTGFLPAILKTEHETLEQTEIFLKIPRTAEELRIFQKETAERTLAVLKAIK
ncbi:MAG: hypothetical protein WAT51_12050, partial [Holophaga sp.]